MAKKKVKDVRVKYKPLSRSGKGVVRFDSQTRISNYVAGLSKLAPEPKSDAPKVCLIDSVSHARIDAMSEYDTALKNAHLDYIESCVKAKKVFEDRLATIYGQ